MPLQLWAKPKSISCGLDILEETTPTKKVFIIIFNAIQLQAKAKQSSISGILILILHQ
jgi:hypothetical protein